MAAIQRGRLLALDGLRGVAVLAVVAHHAHLLPFAIGSRGVELFFVLSGASLSLATLERVAAGLPFRFDRARFAFARAARILPPYYVALALFVALAATPFGYPSAFAPATRFEWVEESLLLTLHPSYNASFWSLVIEARWYVVFPALLAAFVYSKRLFYALALAAYGISFWQPWIVDAGTLPCFMLGIVAADLYVRGKTASPLFAVAACVLVALGAALDTSDTSGDPIWHLASFTIVVAGLGSCLRVMQWRPLAALGGASYSIYLIHQPMLAWLVRSQGIPGWLAAPIAIGAGLVFWKIVEAPSVAFFARRRAREVPTVLAGTVAETLPAA